MSGVVSGSIEHKLQSAQHVINQIRSLTGNAGLSVGILHHGKPIYQEHFGYRDVATKTVADGDTQYHLASMSKAFSGALLGILVDEGRFHWDTPLHELIPGFADKAATSELPQLKEEATLQDILSHRLGLTQRNMFRLQSRGKLLLKAKDTVDVVVSLKPVGGFRTKMTYTDWTFSLTDRIVQEATGQSIGTKVQELLLEPLGLKRTTLGQHSPENHVTSYMALTNATPVEAPPPPFEDGQIQTSTTAVKSTINDLLVFYKALLAAGADQLASGGTSTPGSPFRRVADTWKSHIEIDADSSYGIGWVLTNLPGRGGLVGMNSYESDGLPIIGKGTKEQRLIYHQGSINGALSAVYLLPETDTAVVALSNSFDLGDTPDWAAQVLLEILLESPEPNDYVELARKTAQNCISRPPRTNKKLAEERILNTQQRPIGEYVGKYASPVNDFFVEVTPEGEGLRLRLQGIEDVFYDMYHYHHDIFAWEVDRDAQAREAMWPISIPGFFKIDFKSDETGSITHLVWALDRNVPEGELFNKVAASHL